MAGVTEFEAISMLRSLEQGRRESRHAVVRAVLGPVIVVLLCLAVLAAVDP